MKTRVVLDANVVIAATAAQPRAGRGRGGQRDRPPVSDAGDLGSGDSSLRGLMTAVAMAEFALPGLAGDAAGVAKPTSS